MKEIVLQTPPIIEAEAQESEIRQKTLSRWTFILFVSMGGGIFLGLTGLVLGAISYLVAFKNADRINFAGNFMLIAAFPLMMFGAHALDKISEIKKGRK